MKICFEATDLGRPQCEQCDDRDAEVGVCIHLREETGILIQDLAGPSYYCKKCWKEIQKRLATSPNIECTDDFDDDDDW